MSQVCSLTWHFAVRMFATEMPCHKYVLWNQMNRCEVVSCRNNIVWIIIIVVLAYLLLSLSYSGNLTFQSFSCHKTILVSFSKKLRFFPQISRHNPTAISAKKKKNCNTPRLAEKNCLSTILCLNDHCAQFVPATKIWLKTHKTTILNSKCQIPILQD